MEIQAGMLLGQTSAYEYVGLEEVWVGEGKSC